jgi:TonB family protein
MNALLPHVTNYIVNSLWMCPLVFAAAWLMSRMAARVGPRAEHVVWVGALWLQALLPAWSMRPQELWRLVRTIALWPWSRAAAGNGGGVSVSIGPARVAAGIGMPHALMLALVLVYGCVALYFAVRLMVGVWRTLRIERRAELVVLAADTAKTWERSRRWFDVTTARVAESTEVAGPVTVGLRRGVLLVPRGFLESARAVDLEAAMAHECAHMRRRDFAKNLIYQAITLPLAYHPIAHRTLERVAESREMVCDALAAEAVEGGESFARSLLRLATLMATAQRPKTLHAIGILDANTFERRVMRLTTRSETGLGLRLTVAAVCLAAGAATCASAMTLRLEVAASGTNAAEHRDKAAAVKIPSAVLASLAVYQKHPMYPAEARANKDTIDGPVVLHAVISKEGTVEQLTVKQSLREDYDKAALDAVKEWRYKPYVLNGEPTAVETTITVNYSIGK